ncbi:MAG: toll/interleukin-1 receptor domain-containing protein [Cyanobium sp.]
MARLFISYSRSNQAQAKLLAGDLEDLSHSVWLDVELAGGQLWWDQILQEIRGCDVFVLVMSKASVVDSLACKREYQYAADLQKPILPVLVAEDVSVSLLPAELQQVQFVNYQHRDINSIKALARALQALPLGQELPEPLPTAPEPPISYLASLSNQIDLASFLDLEAQSRIVIELKSSLRDSATSLDAQLLLKRLRGRHDLFAKIAEDIDQVLVPSRPSRRLIATPQAARPKSVPTPLIDMAEREKIAQLKIGVQLLLWATPFTAFVSARNFQQKWLHALAYSYLFFGVLLVYYLAGAFAFMGIGYFLPIAAFAAEKYQYSSSRVERFLNTLVSLLVLLCAFYTLQIYVLPYQYNMATLYGLPLLMAIHCVLGALLVILTVMLSRKSPV